MEDLLFNQNAIFLPLLMTLLLGLIVWLVMFAVRFKAIAAANIQPDQLATPDMVNQALPGSAQNPANNFKNFFEVPVMFFVLCFYLQATNNVDSLYVNLAWVFVAFRYIHSAIQCSYNNVNHRFGAYAISCIALWVMLIRALLGAF
ncbi:MAPEG family protein [Oceanicoccus sp. KOV_DT_Chl]|uniref:MAPEG family protein n=1 Tax=Oceanicoccus sp. KOV_DT_Chl TaxID=1904639 RepID=UPI000C7E2F73|nr:MAPEG family protein [Oceanicoccus sp. KOV_DT_Chl]